MKKENYLYILILIGLPTFIKNARADEFDTSLLVGKSAQGDISRFNGDSTIPSGKQLVDVYINNAWKGQFVVDVNDNGKQISLDPKDIDKLGLNLSPEVIAQSKTEQSVAVDSLVPNIHYKLNISSLRLDINVPQVSVKQSEAGYVDPSLWSHGLPAIIFGYNTNYYSYKEKKDQKRTNDTFSATLNSGVNLGA